MRALLVIIGLGAALVALVKAEPSLRWTCGEVACVGADRRTGEPRSMILDAAGVAVCRDRIGLGLSSC